MKIKNYIIFYWILFLSTINLSVFGQCTEAKDPEMAKYMHLTKTQDAQSCSECGMLALYFCSAKYCVQIEDKRKVGSLITACKKNILIMGQPYCCPDYINQEPQWGLMVGGTQNNQTSGSANFSEYATPDNTITLIEGNSNQGYNSAQSNPMINNNASSNVSDQEVEQLINDAAALVDVLSGGDGTAYMPTLTNPMANSYGSGYDQDVADVINNAAVLGDLLTGGDGNLGGLGGLSDYSDLGGLGSLADGLNQLGAEAEAQRQRDAQAAAIRQQEQARKAAAEAEIRAKQQQLIASRKGLIAKFPDGKTPLSSNAADASEVYFFTYSCDESAIETNAPMIFISNTFAVPKYADGTWPFKNNLMENIAKSVNVPGLKLSGYYMSKSQAEQQQQVLANGARVYGFAVKNFFYEPKRSAASSGVQTDYWGIPIKTGQEQQNAQEAQVQESANNKTKLDYWGNPINESVAVQKTERIENKEVQSSNEAENKRLEEEIRIEVEKIKAETAQKKILEAEKKQREEAEAKEIEQKNAEAQAKAEVEKRLKAEAETKELERKKIEAEVRAELERKLKAEAEVKEAEQIKAEAEVRAEEEKRLKEEAEIKESERKKIEAEIRAKLELEMRAEAANKEAERKKMEEEIRAKLEKELRAEAEAKALAEAKPVEIKKEEVKINQSAPVAGNYFIVKNKQALLRANFKVWNNNLFAHKQNIEKLKVKKKTSAEEARYMNAYYECAAEIEKAKALADVEITTLAEIDNLTIKIDEQLKNLENIRSVNRF